MFEKLNNFLKGEDVKAVIEKRDYIHSVYYTYFIKINSGIEDIDLIYTIETTSENVIGIFSNMKFAGIYHKSQDIFYHAYLYLYNKVIPNNLGTKIYEIDSVKNELIKKVKNKIVDLIGYDEKTISDIKIDKETLEEVEKHTVPRLAYELFMKNEKVNKHEYINFYRLPEDESKVILLEFLDNPEKVVETEAKRYIEKEASYIARSIIKNKSVEKELEKMSKDNKFIERRKIYTILNSEDMKTVNLELKKDEETLKCKVETRCWNYIDSYVYYYNVVGKEKSEQFRKMFEDTKGDASFDYISKITYNRNVLYERA